MIQMNDTLKEKYQNLINYENADIMFNAFENLIRTYGKDLILKTYFETEEECVNNHVIKSSVMRFATDSIEHYIKAILIQNGSNWNEAKSWGHNLLDLFNNLDEESRRIIMVSLMPSNEIDYIKYEYALKNYNEVSYLYKLLLKYGHIKEEKMELNNIDYSQYEYKNNYNKKEHDKTPILQQDNIIPLKNGQTVSGELSKLDPKRVSGQSRQQLLNIRARFPGQYIVDGNVEFLISLAYALNSLSKYYRKRNKRNLSI